MTCQVKQSSKRNCLPPLHLKMRLAPADTDVKYNMTWFPNSRVFLTRLTELEALPVCQLLVQDVSQDGGQQQDGPADGGEVGGDQAVGHEGQTAFGCRCIAYKKRNSMNIKQQM